MCFQPPSEFLVFTFYVNQIINQSMFIYFKKCLGNVKLNFEAKINISSIGHLFKELKTIFLFVSKQEVVQYSYKVVT